MVPARMMDVMSRRSVARGGLQERVRRVCVRAQEPLELLENVASEVHAEIPYDASGWMIVDPDTMLITGIYAENVERERNLALVECELAEDDVNKFWEIASRESPAASLSSSTDGDLRRSVRWRRCYEPAGYGDELRAVFASAGAVWGNVCISRLSERQDFSPDEVDVVARLAPHIGSGIRACILLAETADRHRPAGGGTESQPGLMVVADDGSVESMTPEAARWVGSVEDEALDTSIVLHEVVHRARALADDGDAGPPACAHVRARSGEWIVVRGARLADRPAGRGGTALVLEPARRSDIAPMLLRLHQLTRREQEVTQLLLLGMATGEIAHRLWITPETLRGHVKAVFAKLGVGSRPELAALLSAQPVVRVPAAVRR
ncbi:transcriptional regulator, LuxR family [Beutenbergia cavernae DSM 12333]|uniref:Transcriptional regulator, LuxR family n=2 Tax=Beutenbergia TaxID=84756 RepID=C5BZL1_BEUC1|nr:transcriptional regulator, LuxR family [Beutenbergia cavernae DSM 12333]